MDIQIEYWRNGNNRVIAFQANTFGLDAGFGYGYDGQNFCTARFDDSLSVDIWSSYEQRPIESYGGWRETGPCPEANLPYSSWAENLRAAQAEAYEDFTAYESAREAELQEALAAYEAYVSTPAHLRVAAEPEPISQQWITIGGNSAFGWQWRRGVSCRYPSPEEREFIAQQGWEIFQDPNRPNTYLIYDPATPRGHYE